MKPISLVAICLVAGLEAAPAQAPPGGLCFRDRPLPACSEWWFTDAGAYTVLGPSVSGQPHGAVVRTLSDLGLMMNVGRRDAIGASLFGYLDWGTGGMNNVGAEIRYRRWLGDAGSLEVGVGMPFVSGNGEGTRLLAAGLFKWNPASWLGLALRPEIVQQTESRFQPTSGPCYTQSYDCGTYISTTHVKPQLALGLELGRVPGLVANCAAAALFAVFVATYHGSN